MKNKKKLNRHLNTRHISMIAIGGSIGTGIFIASGNALYIAGPGGTILAYILVSIMVYFLMSSLAEMSALLPVTGSFCDYCSRFVSPAFGFSMSYNYWFNWAITIAVDLSSASFIMRYWFPHVPFSAWCIFFFLLITLLNIFPVKLYGEIQYWFSTIKITTIIIFVVVSTLIILGIIGNQPMGYKNWVAGDAPFHHGWIGFISVLMVAGFSFQGIEIFGITAGEMKNPKKNLPKAVKNVFRRIVLFYFLSILVISFIIPYTNHSLMNADITNIALSPFTIVFKSVGLKFASSILNIIILTAVLSACNSSMYAATRTLWHIAEEGNGPSFLRFTNKNGIPIAALFITMIVGSSVFLSSFFGSGMIFILLVTISSISGFIAWIGIGISHYRFRKAYTFQGNSIKELPYKAKLFPFGPIFSVSFCCLVILGQQFISFINGDLNFGRIIGTYAGIPIFLLLYFSYKLIKKSIPPTLSECSFDYIE